MTETPLFRRPVPLATVHQVWHHYDACRLDECLALCRPLLSAAERLPDRPPGAGEGVLDEVVEASVLAELCRGVPAEHFWNETDLRHRGLLTDAQFSGRYLVFLERAVRGYRRDAVDRLIPALEPLIGDSERRRLLVEFGRAYNTLFLRKDGHPDRIRHLAGRALRLGMLPQYLVILVGLGEAQLLQGDLSAALATLVQVISITSQCDMLRLCNTALLTMASVLCRSGRPQEALDLLERRFDTRHGTSRERCHLALIQGRAHRCLGSLDTAAKLCRQSLAVARRHDLYRSAALALESLMDIASDRGDLRTARLLHADAIALHRHLSPVSGDVAGMLRRQGSLLLQEGHPDRAVQALLEALAMSERTCAIVEKGLCCRNLARAYRELGLFQQADTAARRAVRIFGRMGARRELAQSYLELARTCWAWHVTTLDHPVLPDIARRGQTYTQLAAAWTAAVNAYDIFNELGWKRGITACDKLITTLRRERRPGNGIVRGRDDNGTLGGIVAVSAAMREVAVWIDIASESDDPVLITGENGTGKEVVARRIHARSRRRDGPFVAVNCGAVPVTLFEREFFGHTAGAYTGAREATPGYCEEADGGTLFLDEIGELAPHLQVKLLRVLQNRTFRRLGDPADRRTDLRIIAATNAPLAQRIREQRFRPDLYYRLHTLEIVLPPLRRRPEDILPLVSHFVTQAAGEEHDPDELFHDEVLEALVHYHWPGNVRELETVVRRLTLLAVHRGRVRLAMLPDGIRKAYDAHVPPVGPLNLHEQLRRAEREAIGRALMAASGNKAVAARMLGIGRSALYHRLRRLGLSNTLPHNRIREEKIG